MLDLTKRGISQNGGGSQKQSYSHPTLSFRLETPKPLFEIRGLTGPFIDIEFVPQAC